MAKVQSTGSDVAQKIACLEAQIAELQQQAAPDEGGHRRLNRLTARFCATVKRPGFYADGGNLYLDCKDPPSKSWVFRYKRDGRAHDYGLGPYPLIGLAEARDARTECQLRLRNGADLVGERKAQRLAQRLDRVKDMSFRDAAGTYIAAHQAEWTNAKHAAQWASSLALHVYPIIGKLPVAAIDTPLVMKVLTQNVEVVRMRDSRPVLDPDGEPQKEHKQLWNVHTETASRVRGRIESVLGWAATSGYRTGDNPARWKGHLENLLAKKSKATTVKHLAAVPVAELPAVFAKLAALDSPSSLALRFTILTASRSETVIAMRWAEVDFDAKMWVAPAEHMKTGREHRVPLAPAALAILETCKATLPPSAYVFAANPKHPIGYSAMLRTLKSVGRAETVHGFRSTFSDWCAERTNFAAETRELALAHAVGNKVEAAYRRGDLLKKRRALMDAWAKFATSPAPESNVVQLGKKAQGA